MPNEAKFHLRFAVDFEVALPKLDVLQSTARWLRWLLLLITIIARHLFY